MNEQEKALLAIESYVETVRSGEIVEGEVVARERISDLVKAWGPMPNKIAFGVGYDWMPVAVSLDDPQLSPVLVVGDSGSGKLDLLRMLTVEIGLNASAQVAIVTSRSQEWRGFERIPAVLGVYPSESDAAEQMVMGLSAWAHETREKTSPVVLIVDAFASTLDMNPEAFYHLRWLLVHGPARNIRPIVSVDAECLPAVAEFLRYFSIRFFGEIRNKGYAEVLGVKKLPPVDGGDFAVLERGEWVRFWVPSL